MQGRKRISIIQIKKIEKYSDGRENDGRPATMARHTVSVRFLSSCVWMDW